MKQYLRHLTRAATLALFALLATVTPSQAAAANLQEGHVQEIDLGKATLFAIVDSQTTFEASLLTPEYRDALPGGRLPGVVQTWLLLAGDKKILFDTGWGTHTRGITEQPSASLKSAALPQRTSRTL